jgi:hypothetical protein
MNESQSVEEYRQEFAELKRGFQDLLFANRETAAECSRLICQKAMETAELLTDRVCEETEKDKKKAKTVIDTRVLVKNLAKHKRKVTQTKEDVIRTLERTIKQRQASTTYSSFTSSKRWSDELQNNPLLFESCRFIRQGILDTLSYQAVGLPVWLDHSEWVIAFSIQALSDAIRANSIVRVRLRGASLRHAWKAFSLSSISERQQARWDTLFPSRQAPAGGDRYLVVLPQVLQVMIQAYDDLCGDSKSAKSFGLEELTSEELQARHRAMDWTDASFERGFVPLEQFPCSTAFFQSRDLAWTPFVSSELFQCLYDKSPPSFSANRLFHVRFGNRVDDTPVKSFAAILEEKWGIPTQLTTQKTCWPFLCSEGLDVQEIVKDVATATGAGVGTFTPEQLSQIEKRLSASPVRKTSKRKRSNNKGSNNKGFTVSVKKRNQK